MRKATVWSLIFTVLTGALSFGVGEKGNLFPEPAISVFAQFLSRTFYAIFLGAGLTACAWGPLRAHESRLVRWGLVLGVVVLAIGVEFIGGELRWEPRPGWENIPGKSSGFPSGHATASFALAVLTTILYPRWAILALSCALLVAYSRVEVGAHYPHQVVTGALFGSICALGAGWVWRNFLRKRLAEEGRS